jgi:hypothetical protein
MFDAFEVRLSAVEKKLDKVLLLLTEKKGRAKYQAKYYADRRAAAEEEKKQKQKGLRNPDKNILDLPMGWDTRLGPKVEEWAEVCYRFADARKGPYAFLEWLAYTWNCCTYWCKPITKSGGYFHLFIGFTGTKPLRSKWTENDLFGSVRRTSFTRAQRDQFRDALWWKWGFGVLGKVVLHMKEDEARWDNLKTNFTRPLQLLMGGYGLVEVRQGMYFDPHEDDCVKVGKMYAHAKPDLDRGWGACKRGLFAKVEPHAEFIAATV